MLTLSTYDASILARVCQYENLPLETRIADLDKASPTAREIGLVFLGEKQSVEPEILEYAEGIRRWIKYNRSAGPRRRH